MQTLWFYPSARSLILSISAFTFSSSHTDIFDIRIRQYLTGSNHFVSVLLLKLELRRVNDSAGEQF